MSDLQEVIVKSSINSFNQGYLHGIAQERQRILEIAKSIAHLEHQGTDWLAYKDLEEYLAEGEEKHA